MYVDVPRLIKAGRSTSSLTMEVPAGALNGPRIKALPGNVKWDDYDWPLQALSVWEKEAGSSSGE